MCSCMTLRSKGGFKFDTAWDKFDERAKGGRGGKQIIPLALKSAIKVPIYYKPLG